MDDIDFDSVANELQQYTSLSHDEIVIGLKAMQQRDRNWKNHSLFIARLWNEKLSSKFINILIKNTKFSRSYLFEFLQAGRILIHKQESEIDKIDCTINEFLHKNNIPKTIEVFEVKKIGHYKLDWNDKMFIYSGHIGDKYGDWIFFSTYGEITNESVEFYTKEKALDNKNVITTYVTIKGIEYEIYKFDTNIKTLTLKASK